MTTPWLSLPCESSTARYRYLDDGKIEVDGMGVPGLPSGDSWPSSINRWTGLIGQSASRYGLPAHWIAAIMRIESSGREKACSPCSACPGIKNCSGCCAFGLMQLTRATANEQARAIGMDSGFDIYDPATNIELGTSYLRLQVDRYKDFVAAAVGYNAGKVYCPPCKQATHWGVCTDGSPYPLWAVRFSNAALDNGFPLSGPAPEIIVPSIPVIRELPALTAIVLTAAAAYGGYWATQQSLRLRRRRAHA